MSGAVWVVALYGIVSLFGGIMGYVKAKSRISLVTGSVAGLLLLSCAYGMSHGSRLATMMSFLMALLLGGRFAGTWRRTHRVMPDLIMMVLGFVTLVTVGLALVRGMPH